MNDKKFLAAIIFFGIIFSFVLNQFVHEPARREILNMELETRRLREVEREILELKERYGNLAALVEQKELELDAIKKFFPPTLMQDEFIDELYRAAESHRAQIISVRAGEIISEEKFQSQIVNVNLEADYVSLLNFTREILDGERLTRLEKFLATSEGDRIISCELSFKIFAAAAKSNKE